MNQLSNTSNQTDFRIQELTEEISKLQNTIQSQKIEIERLNQILHNFQQHRFGAHSEKTKYIMPSPEQPMLFNEAEICRETTEPEEETEAIRIDVKSYQRKAKRTKAELTKDLPQKDIIHELPEEGKRSIIVWGKIKRKFLDWSRQQLHSRVGKASGFQEKAAH